MDAMLVFVTDDFHRSVWTNQEIGFAIGRNIPILSLKLENAPPPGFISVGQALNCNLKNFATSAQEICKLLAEKLEDKHRLQDALIAAFVESPDWDETKRRFDVMDEIVKRLSKEELKLIIDGFRRNSQLNDCFYLVNINNRLTRFLKRTTGQQYFIESNPSALKKKR